MLSKIPLVKNLIYWIEQVLQDKTNKRKYLLYPTIFMWLWCCVFLIMFFVNFNMYTGIPLNKSIHKDTFDLQNHYMIINNVKQINIVTQNDIIKNIIFLKPKCLKIYKNQDRFSEDNIVEYNLTIESLKLRKE